jgi:ubiquinone/menaquinone biosynthesis C-methylase UbiE
LTEPDFAQVAPRYDELHPADENWHELVDAIADAADVVGRRILDVGCGTGRLAAALADRGARAWGVEPSDAMLAEAKRNVAPSVGLKQGSAEALPFKSGWFDRTVMRLVVHLVDRPRAFRELVRVLGADGRSVIATFDPSYFAGHWLTPFFPSLEAIDGVRFQTADQLGEELREAGFASVDSRRLTQHASVERETALLRIRNRWISTLRLLEEEEFAAGVERAERELPERTGYRLEWLLVTASKA